MPMPNGYPPSVWDRLMAAANPAVAAKAAHCEPGLTLEQLKVSVARDLEGLLNTRLGIPAELLANFPQARKCAVNYGLRDFAGMCLTSGEDRKIICECVKAAISRFEPRLANVSAEAFIESGSTNQLKFIILATLKGLDAFGPIRFDAMLRPSNLHYSISHSSRR